MSDYLKPIAAALLPNLGGFLGGYLTVKETRLVSGKVTWFQSLKKPRFNPPNYLFGPVWTALYCSMGYASYMVWRDSDGFSGTGALPLALYGTQLAMNWAWTPVLFKYHKLGLASLWNIALWGTIVATIVTFHKVNPTASYMLLPYLGWVSFANYLTFSLWRLNKDKKE